MRCLSPFNLKKIATPLYDCIDFVRCSRFFTVSAYVRIDFVRFHTLFTISHTFVSSHRFRASLHDVVHIVHLYISASCRAFSRAIIGVVCSTEFCCTSIALFLIHSHFSGWLVLLYPDNPISRVLSRGLFAPLNSAARPYSSSLQNPILGILLHARTAFPFENSIFLSF